MLVLAGFLTKDDQVSKIFEILHPSGGELEVTGRNFELDFKGLYKAVVKFKYMFLEVDLMTIFLEKKIQGSIKKEEGKCVISFNNKGYKFKLNENIISTISLVSNFFKVDEEFIRYLKQSEEIFLESITIFGESMEFELSLESVIPLSKKEFKYKKYIKVDWQKILI